MNISNKDLTCEETGCLGDRIDSNLSPVSTLGRGGGLRRCHPSFRVSAHAIENDVSHVEAKSNRE